MSQVAGALREASLQGPPPSSIAPVRFERPSVAPRVASYAGLAGLLLLAAVALGEPLLAIPAGALLAALAAGLALADRPRLGGSLEVASSRCLEGEPLRCVVHLDASRARGALDLVLRASRPEVRFPVVRVDLSCDRDVEIEAAPGRWGKLTVGPVELRYQDRLGLFTWTGRLAVTEDVLVLPGAGRLRALVRPRATRGAPGTQTAGAPQRGTEPEGARLFAPGDEARHVNWRATARTGELWVNTQLPDRQTEVVLLVDTAEGYRGDARTPTSLERAVRGAAELATAYLARRDAVGLLAIGGTLRWVRPGSGERARWRLLDALLELRTIPGAAPPSGRWLTQRLPPRALVLALTPLADEETATALAELRRAGRDVAAVVVEAARPPTPEAAAGTSSSLEALAERLWRLERRAALASLNRAGIAAASWPAGTSIELALAVIERRRSRELA